MKTPLSLRTFYLFSFFLVLWSANSMAATSYTWNGSTSSAWGTSTNWTPNGVPSSTDYIVIQTGTYALKLTANKTIKRYRINSGTMDLDGYTLTVNDQLLMYGGTTTAGKIVQNATNSTYINNATVNCKLNLVATTVTIQHSTMADSVKVKQTTTSGTIYWRGNRFYKHLDIENTSNGNINMGNNPADSCFDGLTMRGRRIRAGYQNPDSYVVGNIVIYDEGTSGTSIGLAGGNGSGGITVDGNIVVNKTGQGSLYFAVTAGTCKLIQTSGHSISEGITGFTSGFHQIMGLTQQGSGGGVFYASGASTQQFALSKGTHGPNIGILDIDLDNVSIDGALVHGNANVVANTLEVTGSDFMAASSFTKTGGTTNYNGGNRFYGPVSIKLDGSANMYFAYANPDTAFSSLQLTSTGNNLVIGEHKEFVLMGDLTCDEQAGSIMLGGTYGGSFTVAGSDNQTLTMEEGNTPLSRNILMNKPSGRVFLSGLMDVDHRLTLTRGIIQTLPSGLVQLRDNASVYYGGDDSYVEGKVKKIGDDTFVFPVGRGGRYKPIVILDPAAATDVFQAEYVTGNSSTIHDHASRDGSLKYMSENEYWLLTRENGSSTPSVSLIWDTISSCRMQTPLTDIHIAGWDGSNWDDLGNGGTLGTIDYGLIQTASAVTDFNMFTLAHDAVMDCCVLPPTIAESGSLSPCEGDSSGIVTLAASGGFNDYNWNLPDGTSAGTGSSIEVSDFQTYSVSRQVCADTASFVATAPTGLHLVVTPQETPSGFNLSCYHASDGVVSVVLGGGTPPYSMDYTYNGQPFPPNFTQLGAGTYTLSVTDQTGCNVADTAELIAPEQPLALGFAGDDVTITAGEAIEIGGDYHADYEYHWYPTYGLSDTTIYNPVAYPSDTTMYILTVGTPDTCVSKDTVIVNVLPWTPTELDSMDIVFIDSIPSHVKGEMIVKFNSGLLKMDRVDNTGIQRGALSLFLTDSIIGLMRLAYYGEKHDDPSVMDDWGIRKIFKRLTSNNQYSTTRLGEQLRIPDFWATFVLTLPSSMDELVAIDSVDNVEPQIKYAEPNHIAEYTSVPNDPLWEDQLGLDSIGNSISDINILPAWDIQTGQDFVKVGVYDSGIEWEHEDFQVDGSGTYAGSKVRGWDYTNGISIGDASQHDVQSIATGVYHGTACAGIIGAIRNNDVGVAGIAGGDAAVNNPGATLYAMKLGTIGVPVDRFFDAVIEGVTDDQTNQFGFAQHVLSHSYVVSPGVWDLQTLTDAVRYSFLNHAVFVCSRGNYNPFNPAGPIDDVKYPACLDSSWVLSIGASTTNGDLYSQSMYGRGVDLIAPGVSELVQTVDGNPSLDQYRSFSGTSASTPIVAGVAALMISEYNHPTPHPDNLVAEDVEFIMKRYAKDRDIAGWDYKTGAGLLDAGACLQKIQQPSYEIIHLQDDNADLIALDTITNLDTVFVHLNETVNGVAPNFYSAYRYRVTHTYEYSVSAPRYILDGWPRPSSTNGYVPDDTQLPPNTYLEDFNITIDNNTATVSLSTFAYFVIRKAGTVFVPPINKWIPDSVHLLDLPFSLHIVDSTFVGIEETEGLNTSYLTLYPNPANDQVNLTYLSNSVDDIEISLFDIMGKRVMDVYSGKPNIGKNEYRFSCKTLARGAYVVKIFQKNHLETKRLIITRTP